MPTKEKAKFKTFEDLQFGPHPSMFFGGKRASMDFPNGYGVSVIQGGGAYTVGDDEYELAVMHGDELCYSTHITNDVCGHVTKKDVTELMKSVQRLKKHKNCKHTHKGR